MGNSILAEQVNANNDVNEIVHEINSILEKVLKNT